MALKNSMIMKIFITLMLLIAGSLQAKIILPELLAKQAVGNIRFLSQDGKFTYYQKRSGSLLYSSNYKVMEILKGQIGTQYTLIGTPARKKIIVMQNENFHTFYALRAQEKIFLLDFGESSPKEVGMGSAAALHLTDTWISYYDYYTWTITFESTANSALKFTIKLNNRINPYFTPQVLMSDDNTIYYTDLSETGAVGLLQYQRNTNKAEVIFKANTPMLKAEICLHNNALIMGLFGINYSKEGTTIYRASLPLTDFSKRETVYNSPVNDFGQMVCNYSKDNLTFIKNYGSSEHFSTDLVDLNPQTKALTLLSEMKTITSVINMDGTLLALDKGKYFIVKGNTDYKNIDSLKSLPPSGAAEAIKAMDKEREDD
jgi:hypothetical protein